MESKNYLKIAQDELSLTDLLNIIKKRKKIAILTILAVLLLTFIYLLIASPKYEAKAKIIVPTSSSDISLSGTAAAILGGGIVSPNIETQIQILKSRSVLKKVVERVNILELSQKFNKKELTINDAVGILEKIISVSSIKATPIIEISIESEDKLLALKILQELLDIYFQTYVEMNKSSKEIQLEVIQSQLPTLEKEITELGEKIKQFKLVNKTFQPSEDVRSYVSKLVTLEKELGSIEEEYKVAVEKENSLKKEIAKLQGNLETKQYTPQSALLTNYIQKLSQLQADYNTMLIKYTEDHPEVITLKKQIEETEKQINLELKRIASSKIEAPSQTLQNLYSVLLETQLRIPILQTRIELIRKAINDTEKKLAEFPQLEQEYIKLQRDFALKQSIYSLLAQKYEELKISTIGVEVNKPKIIDPPYTSETPIKPKKRLILAIGSVLGVFLGIFGSFFVEIIDKRIRSIYDVERITELDLILFGEDPDRALKSLIGKITLEYPACKKLALVSLDSPRGLEKVTGSMRKLFQSFGLRYSELNMQNEDYNLTELLQFCTDEYLLVKLPLEGNNLNYMYILKNVQGGILLVELNRTKKEDLFKVLSRCQRDNIEIFGILII